MKLSVLSDEEGFSNISHGKATLDAKLKYCKHWKYSYSMEAEDKEYTKKMFERRSITDISNGVPAKNLLEVATRAEEMGCDRFTWSFAE